MDGITDAMDMNLGKLREMVRVGSFQPDPQLHNTAHTGVTVLLPLLKFGLDTLIQENIRTISCK